MRNGENRMPRKKEILAGAVVIAVGLAANRHEKSIGKMSDRQKDPDIARTGEKVVAVENVTDEIIQVYPSKIYYNSCKPAAVYKNEYYICRKYSQYEIWYSDRECSVRKITIRLEGKTKWIL